ncbi:MAG: hypothetical protein IPM54_40945 [Polyangiaceae bacterium]|nr:hypothetical protein [Polyangiaceae bacterium]
MPFAGIGHALGELVRAALAGTETELSRIRAELDAALGPNVELVARVVPELGMLFTPSGRRAGLGAARIAKLALPSSCSGSFPSSRGAVPSSCSSTIFQWADPASLKLLKDLLGDPQAAYLLVVTAFRSRDDGERSAPFAARSTTASVARRARHGARAASAAPSDVRSMIAGSLVAIHPRSESLGVLLWSKTNEIPSSYGKSSARSCVMGSSTSMLRRAPCIATKRVSKARSRTTSSRCCSKDRRSCASVASCARARGVFWSRVSPRFARCALWSHADGTARRLERRGCRRARASRARAASPGSSG